MMKLPLLALGAWSLCISSAALAGAATVDTTTTSGDEHVVIKVIKRDAHGGASHENHAVEVPGDCANGTRHLDTNDEVDDGKGQKKRTRIIICSKGEHATGDTAARLTEARKRIAGDDSLSAETKAKVLASLDAEIARVRTAPAK